MRRNMLSGAAVALSLVASPVLANPAASLSVAKSVRASTPSAKSSKLAGNSLVPAILALAIVAGGIYIAVDDDDKAKSP